MTRESTSSPRSLEREGKRGCVLFQLGHLGKREEERMGDKDTGVLASTE
jgi:hypothetical protein